MKNITLYINADKMSATLTLTRQTGSTTPNIEDVIEYITKQGLVFGVSRKRISKLLQQSATAVTKTEHSDLIAKGLLPRNGKNSRIIPIVPNAIDRLLVPQDNGSNRVDMRNLGDIICVKQNTAVAKRIPPTSGRLGKTVTGKSVFSTPGKLIDIHFGTNTMPSSYDEDIIVASMSGQSKFENGVMSIDETLITTGVNVTTGDIQYHGAVIINGDVTENMKITAHGDVTINGYVESAHIHSQGDIIVTQGTTGKMHDEDCQLVAKGNVYVNHAQGTDIIAGKNVYVVKQLAYSSVKTRGSLTVGSVGNPMGNLFASTVQCGKTVHAGSLGAISGSALCIDYSNGYNLINDRLESIVDLHEQLVASNATHETRFTEIDDRQLRESIQEKLQTLNSELDKERILLFWLKETLTELQMQKKEYENNMLVIANKELFPGVRVKLNKQSWCGTQEYLRCNVNYTLGNWQNTPLV